MKAIVFDLLEETINIAIQSLKTPLRNLKWLLLEVWC